MRALPWVSYRFGMTIVMTFLAAHIAVMRWWFGLVGGE